MALDPRRDKVVLLHAVISPYKVTLFNQLTTWFPNLHVIYYSVTEKMRSWKVDRDELRHNYTLLNEGNLESHSWLKISIQVWRELNRIQPDLIIISEYIYPPYWSGLIWAIVHQKKRLFFSESTEADRPRLWWKEWIKRWFVRRCHFGIAQGSQSKAYMHRLGMPNDQIVVKDADGANVARKIRSELVLKWKASSLNILFVGRFAPEKNLITLLDAYEQVVKQHADVGLILVGDGPLQSEIQQLISRRQLTRAVIIPFLQKPDLPAIYGISDIFVLPSISEPWGLVVNEAMACGLPIVVSSKAGSAHDLAVHGKNGFIVNPTDVNEIADAIDILISDTELRKQMGVAAVASVAEFTSEKSSERMATAMATCLDQ
ncbi:glycosyltransferase family 1 protein [bacterium]|nr:glycosyltransferase family 1 protein [bacterium]